RRSPCLEPLRKWRAGNAIKNSNAYDGQIAVRCSMWCLDTVASGELPAFDMRHGFRAARECLLRCRVHGRWLFANGERARRDADCALPRFYVTMKRAAVFPLAGAGRRS